VEELKNRSLDWPLSVLAPVHLLSDCKIASEQEPESSRYVRKFAVPES
jgi:hypothetical protein